MTLGRSREQGFSPVRFLAGASFPNPDLSYEDLGREPSVHRGVYGHIAVTLLIDCAPIPSNSAHQEG